MIRCGPHIPCEFNGEQIEETSMIEFELYKKWNSLCKLLDRIAKQLSEAFSPIPIKERRCENR